jgi:hypothetical protein
MMIVILHDFLKRVKLIFIVIISKWIVLFSLMLIC